jgi:4-amino-4-deoxy-L-arabinose transferase-like glycosyltransferase
MKPEPTLVRGSFLRVALVLASFVVAYGGVLLLEGKVHIGWGLTCLIAAAVMIVVAGRGHHLQVDGERPRMGDPQADDSTRGIGRRQRVRRWLESHPGLGWWLLLAVAIGVGIAFRLHLIGSLPYGIWFDEAQNGIVARRILEDPSFRPVFVGEATQLPALFFYVFALALKLFGNGILALRLVATGAGILTLLFTYLLAKELFDQRIAVLATFFLAVMRWHVNFSRFAMHGIFAPLFMAATFYFLIRGLRGKGAANFVAAGVMMGVGLQGYYSFLLMPLIVVCLLLHHAVFGKVLPWRTLAAGVAAFGISAAAVYAPLGVWALQHPQEFSQRTQAVTITKGHPPGEVARLAWSNTGKHLLMFSSAGDRNGRHNLPGAPMLDRITGCLFALGVGLALWRSREPGHFLLLVWMAVILQAGIWSVDFEAPQAHRTFGLTPAVAVLAALPLGLLWRLARAPAAAADAVARQRSNRNAALVLTATAAIVTLVLIAHAGWRNFDTYFHDQLDRADVWPEYSTDVTVVANEMMRLGPEYDFWLATALVGQPTIEFLASEEVRSRAHPFLWARDVPAWGDGGAAYFLEGTKPGFHQWLERRYPEGSFHAFTAPAPNSPVVVYEAVIPAAAVQALRGLDAVYTPASGQPLHRREAALDLDWSAGAPGPLPLDAVWSGFLSAPEYKEYRLALEAPGEARLILDGEQVAAGSDRIEAVRRLYQGQHALRVEARVDRPGRVRLSWDDAPVADDAFFADPLGGHGLVGACYANDAWEGEPVNAELTPLVGFEYHAELSIGPPLSIRWQGTLDAPAAGEYRFRLQANEYGSLAIDGREVLTTLEADRPVEAPLTLTSGSHPIEVRLRNLGGFARIQLQWIPPGGTIEIIPPERLSPR